MRELPAEHLDRAWPGTDRATSQQVADELMLRWGDVVWVFVVGALRWWSNGKCADHYTREHTTPLELLGTDPRHTWRSFTLIPVAGSTK
jgi:hypothetical protein